MTAAAAGYMMRHFTGLTIEVPKPADATDSTLSLFEEEEDGISVLSGFSVEEEEEDEQDNGEEDNSGDRRFQIRQHQCDIQLSSPETIDMRSDESGANHNSPTTTQQAQSPMSSRAVSRGLHPSQRSHHRDPPPPPSGGSRPSVSCNRGDAWEDLLTQWQSLSPTASSFRKSAPACHPASLKPPLRASSHGTANKSSTVTKPNVAQRSSSACGPRDRSQVYRDLVSQWHSIRST